MTDAEPADVWTWRKSRASQPSGNCVEVGASRTAVRVRDSQDRFGAVLSFSPAGWRAFLTTRPFGKIS